ncbi:unnamed protein product, partial [Rotaria magnacalcarata]
MGKVRLAKIVELAEGCEKQIAEATNGETIKPDIMIETKLASTLDNVTSLRPNGGAVLKLKCNLCNNLINKAEIEINKTVSEFDDQYNGTIVIADLFRDNEASRVDVLNNDSKPKAENVRLATEADVVIQSNNENIKINVLNNNLEPLDVNFDIAVPFIELIQPKNVKVNFEESELGPKAENIEETNCKNSIVDKGDILINNIGPKADDCFSYHDDKIIIVNNKIELRANHIEETKTNLNLQPGKNNKIEITCINIRDEAEEVNGTDVNINLNPDEDIKVNVPEINTELLYESLRVRFPDMLLEPFESAKFNFEKTIIAAQNLKRKEDIETPSAMNVVKDNCKSEIECSRKIKINDQKCKLLPNPESVKQPQTKSAKFDKSCKANSANNNIEPHTCILVESDESKIRNKDVDVVKNILKSDISGNKKGKVNNKSSNLQPKATGIVETRSKSRSNKNVNLNCSKLVTEPKATDVNNMSKLIGQDNKKVKLDVKNVKLKPKAKSVHDINEIVKVKTTYDEVEPKAESLEDILAEFNLQYNIDNGIKITNDKVKPKAVDVKDNSKSNISAGQIVK